MDANLKQIPHVLFFSGNADDLTQLFFSVMSCYSFCPCFQKDTLLVDVAVVVVAVVVVGVVVVVAAAVAVVVDVVVVVVIVEAI